MTEKYETIQNTSISGKYNEKYIEKYDIFHKISIKIKYNENV